MIFLYICVMETKRLNKIKIALLEKGKSQKDLADFLGVGAVSVSRWCTNDVQPSLDTLYKIAEYLDINVCELLVSNK